MSRFEDRLLTVEELRKLLSHLDGVEIRCCAGSHDGWHLDFARVYDVKVFFNEVRLVMMKPRVFINKKGNLEKAPQDYYLTSDDVLQRIEQAADDAMVTLTYDDEAVHFRSAVRNTLVPSNRSFMTLYAPNFQTYIYSH